MDIRNIKIISLVLVCLLSINFVFALGISSPYWRDNPLEMYVGETRTVAFSLVNRIDGGVAEAFVTLEDGAGIAEITSGSDYSVAPGTTNTKILLRVVIPDNAVVGNSYNVRFSVNSVPEGEGAVQFNIRYGVSFPVIVVEKTVVPGLGETKGGIVWVVGVIIVVLVFILIYLGMRKNKGSKSVSSKKSSKKK